MRSAEVVIIGAGVSGLSAARLLARFGRECLLLEGSDRIGGRLYTVRRPGWQLPIELGAEFVHGRPAPTLALGAGAVHLTHVAEQRVRGGRSPQPMPDVWQRFAEILEPACDSPEYESVAGFLERTQVAEPERELVRMIVEGYHAADLHDVSARVIGVDARAVGGDFKQYRTSTGYDAVLAELEHGLSHGPCQVELLTRVRRVAWSRGKVEILADAHGQPLEIAARCCVVTTSLGVLRSAPDDGGIEFKPTPAAFATALPLLGMGHVLRVVLRFARAPWIAAERGHEINFVHAPEAPFATLWREARAEQEQVTAWAGGPQALRLSSLDEPGRLDAALCSLAGAVGSDVISCRRALIEAHCHDFNRDPFTRGAYSYVRPGGEEAAKALAIPCEDTLFFAGEALDQQYPGTVAGALGSGEHAARQVLASWAA
jgi:monoamine oxidase